MIPKLPHRTLVTLVQIDPLLTPAADPQFREPTGGPIYREPVQIWAQLAIGTIDKWNPASFGNDPLNDGHFTIMRPEISRALGPCGALHVGDRVLAMAVGTTEEAATDWSVVEVRPTFHYHGKPNGFMCFYRRMKTLSQTI